jgi:hypothetical protein
MTVSPTSDWLDCPALLAGRAPARTRTSLCSNVAPFPRTRLRCSASCDGAEAHFDAAIHGLRFGLQVTPHNQVKKAVITKSTARITIAENTTVRVVEYATPSLVGGAL